MKKKKLVTSKNRKIFLLVLDNLEAVIMRDPDELRDFFESLY